MSGSRSRSASRVARWFGGIASVPVALLIAFEEWGWEPLSRLMARIARLPALAWAERRIVALPPYPALALLALPWLLLLPLKLFALWLIGNGQWLLGMTAVSLAKVAGTAVVARLFNLTKPALMRLPWFASLYERWTRRKNQLLEQVRASKAWDWGRALKCVWRVRLARWRALLSA